jgi:3-oxoacyl-[acyl-carrier-protein] synthase-1
MEARPFLCDLGIITVHGSGKAVNLAGILHLGGCPLKRERIGNADYLLARAASVDHPSRPDPLDRDGNRVTALLADASDQIAGSVARAISRYGRSRIAVLVGSTDNGAEQSRAAVAQRSSTVHFPEGYSLDRQSADLAPKYLSERLGLHGMSLAVSTACASGATAIARARDLIAAGLCDAAVAGGADIVSDSVAMGFFALEAISTRRCNPFSRNRDGINLGEGAALFLLSRDPLDGSCPRVLGIGESSDAYHMTAPDPAGGGAVRTMAEALRDSGLAASDIDYLNLHGTGTKLNDSMEASAVLAVLGAAVPLSSTKPFVGHTLGAAGAIELGFCWLLLSPLNSEGRLPPHVWDGEADESLPRLSFVGPDTRNERLRICMSNSFAFGGVDVSLIIGG